MEPKADGCINPTHLANIREKRFQKVRSSGRWLFLNFCFLGDFDIWWFADGFVLFLYLSSLTVGMIVPLVISYATMPKWLIDGLNVTALLCCLSQMCIRYVVLRNLCSAWMEKRRKDRVAEEEERRE